MSAAVDILSDVSHEKNIFITLEGTGIVVECGVYYGYFYVL